MFTPTECSTDVKRALVILAVGHVVFTGITVGNAAVKAGTLNVDVRFQEATVVGENVTSVTLTLTNHGSRPVRPVVRIPSQAWSIQNAWAYAGEDAPVIMPGDSLTVTVTAPGDRAQPCVGDQVLVVVENRSTQQRATLGPVTLGDGGLVGGRCRV